MGRVVTFGELTGKETGNGVSLSPVTVGDTQEMAVELVRVAAGRSWKARVPHGSDCYLFALRGGASLSCDGQNHALSPQTFATVQEGSSFVVDNGSGSGAAEILKVIAPPQPSRDLPGFGDGVAVATRGDVAVVDVPEQKKKRLYFAGHHHGAKTERGHAMIVVYEKETATALHQHPNAESMFVLLDGELEFTINGEQVIVKPGQAAYFPTGDKHGLHVAKGHDGASFLEFHVPGAFSTVKD